MVSVAARQIYAERLGGTNLVARHHHRIGPGRDCGGNLRCDQESRQHRRHADESQELIYGKHRPIPQKSNSDGRLIRPLRRHLLADQKLVAIGRSGDREQRENADNSQRFHDSHGRFRLWPKTSALRAFSGRSSETTWPVAQIPPHPWQAACLGIKPKPGRSTQMSFASHPPPGLS